MRCALFSCSCAAESQLEWQSVVILVPFRRRPTDRRAAIVLLPADELDSAGRHLVARPVLAVVPRPDPRILRAVHWIPPQLSLDKDMQTLASVLVHRLGQLAPAGNAEPGGELPALAVDGLLPVLGAGGDTVLGDGLAGGDGEVGNVPTRQRSWLCPTEK